MKKNKLTNQMESLAEELIQEVKSLKDLTKEELPEIAKEYVRFNTIVYLTRTLAFGLLAVVGVALFMYGIFHEGYISSSPESATVAIFFGGVFAIVTGVASITSLVNYLDFKLQPRRNAIKGITSLFNEGE